MQVHGSFHILCLKGILRVQQSFQGKGEQGSTQRTWFVIHVIYDLQYFSLPVSFSILVLLRLYLPRLGDKSGLELKIEFRLFWGSLTPLNYLVSLHLLIVINCRTRWAEYIFIFCYLMFCYLLRCFLPLPLSLFSFSFFIFFSTLNQLQLKGFSILGQ